MVDQGLSAFLNNGDATCARFTRIDWSATPLGPVDSWPTVIKSTLATWMDSPQAMFLAWGPDLRFFFNDAYAPMLLERVEGAMGRPFHELWSDVWDDIEWIVIRALAGEGTRIEEMPLSMVRHGVRKPTWWTFTYMPVRDDHANIVGMMCTVVDVTSAVQARAQADRERERQRLLLQQMPGFAGLLYGPEHIFDYVNDSYQALFGPRPFVGQAIRDVFPELEGQGFYELLHAVYTTGEPIVMHGFPIQMAGEAQPRYLDFLYHPVRNDVGDIIGIFTGGYEVTENVRAEEALRLMNETLEHRVQERTSELLRAQEALRQSQKMEAIGQLTGGLAHDFNNLLTGISGSLELMRRRLHLGTLDRASTERYIDTAQGAAQRAASVTHRMLAFARRQTLDPQPTDMNRLVHDMVELLRRTVGPAIPVEVLLAPGLWLTMVDAVQLDNALLNLSINARDAMPHGGRLTIATANRSIAPGLASELGLVAGDYVALSVTDDGIGMTPDTVARAVEPFFTTKPLGQGTGLGLSMVYGFARQSGGVLRIESTFGEGTTMSLFLPRVDGASSEGSESAGDAAAAVPVRRARVLVVDDEITVRMLVTEVLKDAGMLPIEAEDGPSAMTVLQSDVALDLMVTDVGLPGGMNGRQLADAARAQRPDLKVLFITGYAENALIGDGVLEPGMQVLTKPFTVDNLLDRVRQLTLAR
ncbi:hybrid sensor histidine kinase/response regulator [Pigmentiphaga litoralis]|uniref:PAS domain-containing protein n=1 Tax=Pigmentiphaga litoralis TaxID=516702 RepID=UPI00167BE074|nr:PAS domain-containing protein [Pigmentiphaga litoralis]GGX24700.1 hybrid sensor histidine kinase/response regulator [Pigmentiphaga litoralis]